MNIWEPNRRVWRHQRHLSVSDEASGEGERERFVVRIGCCVLLMVVVMESRGGVARAYRGVNEDVAIEYDS